VAVLVVGNRVSTFGTVTTVPGDAYGTPPLARENVPVEAQVPTGMGR